MGFKSHVEQWKTCQQTWSMTSINKFGCYRLLKKMKFSTKQQQPKQQKFDTCLTKHRQIQVEIKSFESVYLVAV
jgi:hypothetical protein